MRPGLGRGVIFGLALSAPVWAAILAVALS